MGVLQIIVIRPSICCSMFFPRASERRVLPIVGVCKTSSLSSHLLLIPHLLIFTSSQLHIFSSSHLLIFTSSHLHIFSTSHLLILTSSPHLLIFTSPHLLIFTSSHLHIFSSSHLLIFTSSHLHIFSHLLTSSHIFSHLHSHLLTSSHIFSSSHLLLLPSCSLLLFYFSLKAGAGAVPTRRHETQPFHTKWRSIVKNWDKIAILLVWSNPFARNEGRSSKTEIKLRFYLCLEQPFRTKWGSIVINWGKIVIFLVPEQLSHEMRVDRQKLR